MKKSKQNKKTAYLDKAGIFWNQKDERTRITTQDPSPFISTVSPDPKSKRGNPNLFYTELHFGRTPTAPVLAELDTV